MKAIVNGLSLFRIITSFAIVFTLLFQWYLLSFVLYLLGAISDWLDGYLARKFNCTSKLGGVMDHIGDKLLVANTLIILMHKLPLLLQNSLGVIPTYMVIIPIVIMIARELYISGLREFLGTLKMEMPVPKARFSLGKVKTTLQMVSTCLLLLALSIPRLLKIFPSLSLFSSDVHNTIAYCGFVGLWLAMIASLWSAGQYTKTFLEKLRHVN